MRAIVSISEKVATLLFYYEFGSVFCRGWLIAGYESRSLRLVTDRFSRRVNAPSPVGLGKLLMRTLCSIERTAYVGEDR